MMVEDKQILLSNLDKVHTTEMGIERIKRNLKLETEDVVQYCIEQIKESHCQISRKGKNWYAQVNNCIITINAYSYTIITAHRSNSL